MAARGRGIIFFVFVVLWRVLFPPDPVEIVIQADTPAESFSAASALATGERMGQSAEWTIATVLVIGSALIGLNWYQGDRRHQHDMAEMEKKIAALKATMESRLGVIELATVGTLEYMNFKSIDEAL